MADKFDWKRVLRGPFKKHEDRSGEVLFLPAQEDEQGPIASFDALAAETKHHGTPPVALQPEPAVEYVPLAPLVIPAAKPTVAANSEASYSSETATVNEAEVGHQPIQIPSWPDEGESHHSTAPEELSRAHQPEPEAFSTVKDVELGIHPAEDSTEGDGRSLWDQPLQSESHSSVPDVFASAEPRRPYAERTVIPNKVHDLLSHFGVQKVPSKEPVVQPDPTERSEMLGELGKLMGHLPATPTGDETSTAPAEPHQEHVAEPQAHNDSVLNVPPPSADLMALLDSLDHNEVAEQACQEAEETPAPTLSELKWELIPTPLTAVHEPSHKDAAPEEEHSLVSLLSAHAVESEFPIGPTSQPAEVESHEEPVLGEATFAEPVHEALAENVLRLVQDSDVHVSEPKAEPVEEVHEPKWGGPTDFGSDAALIAIGAFRSNAELVRLGPIGHDCPVYFQIDGKIHHVHDFEPEEGQKIIAWFKHHADSQGAVQDGKYGVFHYAEGQTFDIYGTTTATGELLTARVVKTEPQWKSFEEAGLSASATKTLKDLLARKQGLVLLAAPQREAAMLAALCSQALSEHGEVAYLGQSDHSDFPLVRWIKLDPEHPETHGLQAARAVGFGTGPVVVESAEDPLTAAALAAAVRQGRLVVACVEATDAVGAYQTWHQAVRRASPYESVTAIGILAKQEIRLLCAKCKKKAKPTESQAEAFKAAYPEAEVKTVWNAEGCDECFGIGYAGLAPHFEVYALGADDQANLALDPSGARSRESFKSRECSYSKQALKLVMDGKTSWSEASGWL